MPEALDPSAYVFEGVWTNWSKSRVLGTTLTLTPRNAAVLVAILALFVQTTGSQLWIFIRFAIHQYRASAVPADGLYHQHQAILRNSLSDLSLLVQILRTSWSWRHTSRRTFHRSILLILLALLHFAAFGFAGVFASRITNAGDETLSRSPFCGTLNTPYASAIDRQTLNPLNSEYSSKLQCDTQLSQEYVAACYNVTSGSSSCNTFRKSQLNWTKQLSQHCPFHPPVCAIRHQSIAFDTGLIDSRDDLGINAADEDRLQYRRVTTCTPLNDHKYVSGWQNATSPGAGQASGAKVTVEVVNAYYGPSDGGAQGDPTFSYGDFSSLYTGNQVADIDPYQLGLEWVFAGDGQAKTQSSFVPIAELNRTDADVTLAFLSFNGAYTSPVDDPWFFAKYDVEYYSVSPSGVTSSLLVYIRDRPVSTLGCTEQHQFCTGQNGSCTALLGSFQIQQDPRGVASLKLNGHQNITLDRMYQAMYASSMSLLVQILTTRDMPLLARRSVSDIVGLAVANNQWQLEMEYWFSIAMAHLQRIVVEVGTGQIVANTDYLNLTRTPDLKWLCDNLVIRGTAYQSFSVLALALIFMAGLFIVVLSYFIEDLVAYIQRKLKRGAIRREMWMNTELLQFQRMVYDRLEQGTWHDGPGNVPLTQSGDMLDMLHLQENRATIPTKPEISEERSEKSNRQSQAEALCVTQHAAAGPQVTQESEQVEDSREAAETAPESAPEDITNGEGVSNELCIERVPEVSVQEMEGTGSEIGDASNH